MKVAYVVSRFPKISETFILLELLELEQLGVEVELYTLVREHEDVVHPEAAALAPRVRTAPLLSRPVLAAQAFWLARRPLAYAGAWLGAVRGNLRSPGFLLRALYVLPKAALFARDLRARGVEHVHAHYATHPALAAWTVSRLTGIPYSFTVHAHDLYVDRAMLEEKLREAAFAVTVSEYNRRLLGELYPGLAGKAAIVRSGVDTAVFRPRSGPRDGGPFTVVCVASLEGYKGHGYLVEACDLLRRRGIDLRCLLVGDGEERGAIERELARRGLQETVMLLGRQPRERVSALLRDADALVQPSVTTPSGKMEGLPVALIEALATGLPVVATAISGVPELVEDGRTGLLVPERDAAALAAALARLHDDAALCAALGEAGRRTVEEEYDLRRNVRALHDLLAGSAA